MPIRSFLKSAYDRVRPPSPVPVLVPIPVPVPVPTSQPHPENDGWKKKYSSIYFATNELEDGADLESIALDPLVSLDANSTNKEDAAACVLVTPPLPQTTNHILAMRFTITSNEEVCGDSPGNHKGMIHSFGFGSGPLGLSFIALWSAAVG